MDRTLSKMMAKIVSAINTAHGYTHPLFCAIFSMSWTENGQWIPDIPGVSTTEWMKPIKELGEYFDFLQNIFGGAIAEVFKGADQMFTTICQLAN